MRGYITPAAIIDQVYHDLNSQTEQRIEIWEVEELLKTLSNLSEEAYENRVGLS